MQVSNQLCDKAIYKGYNGKNLEQANIQAWLRTKGIHIELLLDMYNTTGKTGNEGAIVKGEYLCYTAFVYQVGQPCPMSWDDLGHGNYELMLEIALEHALELL